MTHRCIEYGLPEPKFEIQDGFVAIIYRKQGIAFEKVGGENNPENITENITENVTENITERLTKNQEIIIEEISKNPYITSEEISGIIGIDAVNIRVNISKLKAKGFIERIGPDKGGYWKVIK